MRFQNRTVGLGYKWGVRERRRRGPCDFEVLRIHVWEMVKSWAHMVGVLGSGKLGLGRGTVLI